MQRLASLNSHTGINAARLLKIALEAAQQHSESPPKRLWPCGQLKIHTLESFQCILTCFCNPHLNIHMHSGHPLQPFQNSQNIKDTRNNISIHCILWHHCANYDSQVSIYLNMSHYFITNYCKCSAAWTHSTKQHKFHPSPVAVKDMSSMIHGEEGNLANILLHSMHSLISCR